MSNPDQENPYVTADRPPTEDEVRERIAMLEEKLRDIKASLPTQPIVLPAPARPPLVVTEGMVFEADGALFQVIRLLGRGRFVIRQLKGKAKDESPDV